MVLLSLIAEKGRMAVNQGFTRSGESSTQILSKFSEPSFFVTFLQADFVFDLADFRLLVLEGAKHPIPVPLLYS
ncbi:hypothetical protein CEF21_06560 [Bacillus sp. FJAT-42376]|uniref:hypothetical protein n=1 Tax=Bacillus sp. FJAT-42376 TaxID=2014076 RepID=UPI000F4F880E|nr:hypothetical protein [Bacillus sp. FJAT-42376]AZB41980.1 hypothetical protein CEF21_06560 [Bacillus sp. FJAT-42376]